MTKKGKKINLPIFCTKEHPEYHAMPSKPHYLEVSAIFSQEKTPRCTPQRDVFFLSSNGGHPVVYSRRYMFSGFLQVFIERFLNRREWVRKGFLCLTALALTFSFSLVGSNFAAADRDSSQSAGDVQLPSSMHKEIGFEAEFTLPGCSFHNTQLAFSPSQYSTSTESFTSTAFWGV